MKLEMFLLTLKKELLFQLKLKGTEEGQRLSSTKNLMILAAKKRKSTKRALMKKRTPPENPKKKVMFTSRLNF